MAFFFVIILITGKGILINPNSIFISFIYSISSSNDAPKCSLKRTYLYKKWNNLLNPTQSSERRGAVLMKTKRMPYQNTRIAVQGKYFQDFMLPANSPAVKALFAKAEYLGRDPRPYYDEATVRL